MAEIIQFDTGEKVFSLNEKVEVTFNPMDIAFLEELYSAAEELDKRNSAFKDAAEKIDGKEVFDLARACNEEMREILDGIFDKPICADLFPSSYVMAIGDGFPVWANLLYALVDKMDDSLSVEKGRAKERIRKYSAKYKRK